MKQEDDGTILPDSLDGFHIPLFPRNYQRYEKVKNFKGDCGS